MFITGLSNYHKFVTDNNLKSIITVDSVKYRNDSVIFKNQKIVFTGFRNKECEDYIEKNGEIISSSTTILVCRDDSRQK